MIDKIEKDAVIALFPFMGKEPLIIDVGSNKGHWADIILEEFNGNCELHLIEPVEKLLSFTQIKYEYRRNISYANIALDYDRNDRPFFYFENFNNELSSFYKNTSGWEGLPMQAASIKTITLDEYYGTSVFDGDIDILKIDVEGAEVDVLKGADELLGKDKIKIIQIEYSEHWLRSKYVFTDLAQLAALYGYKIYRYIGNNFWEVKEENPPYDNYYLTKFNIHNYSEGWNNEFVLNTLELGKFDFMLEVGNFEGLNTRYMCEKLLNTGGRVICVDPMEDYYTKEDTEHTEMFINQYQRFLANTRGFPIELRKGLSQDELPKLHAFRFGLIYVDGDHRKNAVYFDACWAFAICKEQGYIILDDYGWRDETKDGIDRFLNEFSGNYDLISKGYQVVIRKVTNKYNELTQSYYL